MFKSTRLVFALNEGVTNRSVKYQHLWDVRAGCFLYHGENSTGTITSTGNFPGGPHQHILPSSLRATNICILGGLNRKMCYQNSDYYSMCFTASTLQFLKISSPTGLKCPFIYLAGSWCPIHVPHNGGGSCYFLGQWTHYVYLEDGSKIEGTTDSLTLKMNSCWRERSEDMTKMYGCKYQLFHS